MKCHVILRVCTERSSKFGSILELIVNMRIQWFLRLLVLEGNFRCISAYTKHHYSSCNKHSRFVCLIQSGKLSAKVNCKIVVAVLVFFLNAESITINLIDLLLLHCCKKARPTATLICSVSGQLKCPFLQTDSQWNKYQYMFRRIGTNRSWVKIGDEIQILHCTSSAPVYT